MSTQQQRRAAGRERVVVAAGLLALTLVMTSPLAWHVTSALPGNLDDPLFNAFVLAWDASRFARLFDGLWDCPFFYPARDTLAFSDHLFGIALFTSPVQWATGNAVLAYNLAFLFSSVLSGFGAYLLTRALWGRRDAAWIGAIAFAFAPHRLMQSSHLQILMSGWMPLGLYGLHRYFATGSRGALALFGAATVLQSLSSGYLMYLWLVPVLAVTSGEIVRWTLRRSGPLPAAGPRNWWRLAADLGLTAALCLLALAPTAAAYLRVRAATGFRRSLGEMTAYSGTLADYLRVSRDSPVWSGLLEHGALERALFPGLAIVTLALIGLVAAVRPVLHEDGEARRRSGWPERRFLTAIYSTIAGAAVWLSLGPITASPYRLLLRLVPGFDGLRAPGRFAVIVSLALAVLAAGGAAWLFARLGRRARIAVALAVGLLILAEGYGGPMRVASFDPAQRQRRDLNGWLRAAPSGAVLELPIAGPELAPFTLPYQFNTLIHGRSIVNGYSGTSSGLQDFLGGPGSPVHDPEEVSEVMRGLSGIGVRYIVMHRRVFEDRPELGSPSAAPIIEAIDARPQQLEARAQLGDAIAWRLAAPPPPAPGRPTGLIRLDPGTMAATASAMHDRVRYALDGNVESRWFSGAPQAGGEWFGLDFGRPVDLARVVIRTGRFGLGDRPRRLVVESAGMEHAAPVVLFTGSLVPQLIQSLARGEPGAPVIIDLPPNRSRTLTLRQTGAARPWHWAIHELEIWVRAQ